MGGGWDMFVAKHDAGGDPLWWFQTGTNQNDIIDARPVVDTTGNVFIAGYTSGSLEGHTNSGQYDVALIKLSSSGAMQWSLQRGSSADDRASALVMDIFGDLYITGR